jgi:hypothetical protein
MSVRLSLWSDINECNHSATEAFYHIILSTVKVDNFIDHNVYLTFSQKQHIKWQIKVFLNACIQLLDQNWYFALVLNGKVTNHTINLMDFI